MILFIIENIVAIAIALAILNVLLLGAIYSIRVNHIEFQRSSLEILNDLSKKVDCRDQQIDALRKKNAISPGKKEFMKQLARRIPTQPMHKYRARFDETWDDGYLNGLAEAMKDED